MLRPRANEIPELIQRLGSRKKSCVDSARARLSIIGARAVEDLIVALEGDNNRIRGRVMPLLALIQDPRGRGPLVAMLLDRSSRLRETAAQSLGRFPSGEAVAALGRVIERDRAERVKVAAVRALVEQYASGEEQALLGVLELLADSGESTKVRLAAFALLPLLRSAERRSLLARLKRDPVEEIRQRAEQFEIANPHGVERRPAEIGRRVADLASADYAVWNQAVQDLAACGSSAIQPLLAEMQSRAHDPEYCTRAGMALKAMGPRRGRPLADALDTLEEPLPLQVLVEAIGALGEKSLIYRLKELIERLAYRPTHPAEANGLDLMQRVRAKAHLELARIGSRVAIQNLREALGDPDRRLEIEMLAAAKLIGKREEIGVLLRAYGREDDFMRLEIADVVRTIMKRERIRRNNRMFLTLSADQRRALRAILPASPTRRRPSRTA